MRRPRRHQCLHVDTLDGHALHPHRHQVSTTTAHVYWCSTHKSRRVCRCVVCFSGEFYLGFSRQDLQGVSWYRLLHWECTREAQTKHRLSKPLFARSACMSHGALSHCYRCRLFLSPVTQSEQERSCILLAQFQNRAGEWIWMHCVLQVKEGTEGGAGGQQPIIVCTNQVLSDAEAAVMRTNTWLYHYYSIQNKLQYGLAAYDVAPPPSTRLL